ncbi:MAG TPA: PIN domain-containing protein, partial [Chloroflexota bacterium]|nr:PIN domain-containing protein [Chloroflexota bacterium]
RDLLVQLLTAQAAVLSTQCLAEFFSVSTRHLAEPLSAEQASQRIGRYVDTCRILDVNAAVVLAACRGVADHQLQWWDALIWGAAEVNAIPYVLSEDQQHGRRMGGVGYLNPFTPGFSLPPG